MESKLSELERMVRKGLEEAHIKLLEFKKSKKSPLVVEKDGQIVEITVD